MENIFCQVEAERRLLPVVFRGDGARLRPDVGRKSRPEDYEIEMAGVIREIDALTFAWLATGPLNLNAADAASDGGKQAGNRMNAAAHDFAFS